MTFSRRGSDSGTRGAVVAYTGLRFGEAAGLRVGDVDLERGRLRVTPHDLRDTAASLAVSSGATVKAVQRMLGHASAAMTLDVYTGLFDDELDDVADRMSGAAETAREKAFPPLVVGRLGDLVLPAQVPHGTIAAQAGQHDLGF